MTAKPIYFTIENENDDFIKKFNDTVVEFINLYDTDSFTYKDTSYYGFDIISKDSRDIMIKRLSKYYKVEIIDECKPPIYGNENNQEEKDYWLFHLKK